MDIDMGGESFPGQFFFLREWWESNGYILITCESAVGL